MSPELICFCDYEPAQFYHVSKPRARKQYRCEECFGFIQPGEQYERVYACWENTPSTMKTCERCHDIRVWVKNNVPCFCWYHGNMLEDAKDAVEEAAFRAPAETVGLRFGLQRRIVKLNRHNQIVREAEDYEEHYLNDRFI